MHSQRLSGRPFGTPAQAVQWFGAIQSQDYGPAKWSVGERVGRVRDRDLDRAFDDGEILRTHVLRPTWHFVVPADIRWMLDLSAPKVHALNAYYYRQLGLDDAALKESEALLVAALRGGNRLTRKELAAMFSRADIATAGFRLAYILMSAELNGVICSGGLSGKQQTYALLDDRAPQTVRLTRDEALAELTLRYFTSHGPATAKDFSWWSSLTLTDIRRGLALVGEKLESDVVDGIPFWFAASAPGAGEPSPTVHLLQAYDECTVGYSESKYLLDISGTARAQPPAQGVFNHVILLDSQLVGRWKRTIKKDAVTIEAALFTPFNDAQTEALQVAADKHGAFLGLPAIVATTQRDYVGETS
jgi:hypothetical protein